MSRRPRPALIWKLFRLCIQRPLFAFSAPIINAKYHLISFLSWSFILILFSFIHFHTIFKNRKRRFDREIVSISLWSFKTWVPRVDERWCNLGNVSSYSFLRRLGSSWSLPISYVILWHPSSPGKNLEVDDITASKLSWQLPARNLKILFFWVRRPLGIVFIVFRYLVKHFSNFRTPHLSTPQTEICWQLPPSALQVSQASWKKIQSFFFNQS